MAQKRYLVLGWLLLAFSSVVSRRQVEVNLVTSFNNHPQSPRNAASSAVQPEPPSNVGQPRIQRAQTMQKPDLKVTYLQIVDKLARVNDAILTVTGGDQRPSFFVIDTVGETYTLVNAQAKGMIESLKVNGHGAGAQPVRNLVVQHIADVLQSHYAKWEEHHRAEESSQPQRAPGSPRSLVTSRALTRWHQELLEETYEEIKEALADTWNSLLMYDAVIFPEGQSVSKRSTEQARKAHPAYVENPLTRTKVNPQELTPNLLVSQMAKIIGTPDEVQDYVDYWNTFDLSTVFNQWKLGARLGRLRPDEPYNWVDRAFAATAPNFIFNWLSDARDMLVMAGVGDSYVPHARVLRNGRNWDPTRNPYN